MTTAEVVFGILAYFWLGVLFGAILTVWGRNAEFFACLFAWPLLLVVLVSKQTSKMVKEMWR